MAVLGIDTGSYRARVVAVDGNARRMTLRASQEAPVERSPEGQPLRFAPLLGILQANPEWKAEEQVAAFPLDNGVVRKVDLPFADRGAIARTLPSEVESAVPFDLDEMVLASRIIDVTGNSSRSLAVLVPKDALRLHLGALTAVGVEPRQVVADIEALALHAEKGAQVLVDVGHHRTLLAFCHNGALIAARVVPSAGAAWTEALAERLGVSEADAEAWKHACALPLPGQVEAAWEEEHTDPGAQAGMQAALAALTPAVDAWIAEVRAELIALEDSTGIGIDELLLAGGSAALQGLAARIAAYVGVEVRPLALPVGLDPAWALAVGLAKAAAGDTRVTDLRIGEFAFQGHADRLWNIMMLTALAAGLALVAGGALFGFQYYQGTRRMAQLEEQMTTAVTSTFPDVSPAGMGPSRALAIMQEKSLDAQGRVEKLGAIVSGVPPTLDALRSISTSIPPASETKIDVKELTISDSSISFRAETDSFESASKIEEGLKQDPRYSQARKSDEKKAGDTLAFTITIPLGVEEDGGEADPDAAPAGKEG